MGGGGWREKRWGSHKKGTVAFSKKNKSLDLPASLRGQASFFFFLQRKKDPFWGGIFFHARFFFFYDEREQNGREWGTTCHFEKG
ncbi:hypothetical protein, partial [Enterococcus faecium]